MRNYFINNYSQLFDKLNIYLSNRGFVLKSILTNDERWAHVVIANASIYQEMFRKKHQPDFP